MNLKIILMRMIRVQLGLALYCGSLLGAAYDEPLRLNWGVSERDGMRGNMEDAFAAEVTFNNKNNEAYFGIFDGHGGKEAAIATARGLATPNGFIEPLHQLLAKIKKTDNQRYTDAFELMDKNYLEKSEDDAGTTAVIAHIIKQGSILSANIAWAGDARAILVDRKGKVIQATTDHKPESASEEERIRKAGGFVVMGRVIGNLAVARAIGDRYLKEYVPATPDVDNWDLSQAGFLVLACDGIWDVLSNQGAADIVHNALKDKNKQIKPVAPVTNRFRELETAFTEEGNNQQTIYAARVLRDSALKNRSTDNLSVLVVEFPSAETKPALSPEEERLAAKEARRLASEAEIARLQAEELGADYARHERKALAQFAAARQAQLEKEAREKQERERQQQAAARAEQERLAAKEERRLLSEAAVRQFAEEDTRAQAHRQQMADDEAMARQLAEQWEREGWQ